MTIGSSLAQLCQGASQAMGATAHPPHHSQEDLEAMVVHGVQDALPLRGERDEGGAPVVPVPDPAHQTLAGEAVHDATRVGLVHAEVVRQNRKALAPIIERYGEADVDEPERLHAAGLGEAREGEVGLLRDLQDLHVLASLVQTTWTVIAQGAQGLRDHDLLDVAQHANGQTSRQLTWLNTRMKVAAPQALIVAP